MQYNATIEMPQDDGSVPAARAMWNEISGVGSRQVADRDEVTSRLYTAWLDRHIDLSLGRPYRVTEGERRFVAYPVVQKGCNVRFQVRNGEFYPGLLLERLGMLDIPSPRPTTGGDGWYLANWGFSRYYTLNFVTYEEVPALYDVSYSAVTLAGKEVVLGCGDERLRYSADGLNWMPVDLAGCGSIRALAWDGLKVWVAAAAGIYTVEWSTKTVAQSYAGDFHGFFHNPASAAPQLVEAVAGGGYDVRSGETGNLFFHTDLDVDWPDNTLLWYPHYYMMDAQRQLWTRYAGAETLVEVVPLRFEDGGSRMFMMRGVGVVLAEGSMYTFPGSGPGQAQETLQPAYDFGDVLHVTPSLSGPIVQRLSDGVLFRVRRLSK